jgi:hypothetical protein
MEVDPHGSMIPMEVESHTQPVIEFDYRFFAPVDAVGVQSPSPHTKQYLHTVRKPDP